MELTNYEKLVLTQSIKHRINGIIKEYMYITTLPPALKNMAKQEYDALISAGKKLNLDMVDIESLE